MKTVVIANHALPIKSECSRPKAVRLIRRTSPVVPTTPEKRVVNVPGPLSATRPTLDIASPNVKRTATGVEDRLTSQVGVQCPETPAALMVAYPVPLEVAHADEIENDPSFEFSPPLPPSPHDAGRGIAPAAYLAEVSALFNRLRLEVQAAQKIFVADTPRHARNDATARDLKVFDSALDQLRVKLKRVQRQKNVSQDAVQVYKAASSVLRGILETTGRKLAACPSSAIEQTCRALTQDAGVAVFNLCRTLDA